MAGAGGGVLEVPPPFAQLCLRPSTPPAVPTLGDGAILTAEGLLKTNSLFTIQSSSFPSTLLGASLIIAAWSK